MVDSFGFGWLCSCCGSYLSKRNVFEKENGLDDVGQNRYGQAKGKQTTLIRKSLFRSHVY